jgi:hypothetical protein
MVLGGCDNSLIEKAGEWYRRDDLKNHGGCTCSIWRYFRSSRPFTAGSWPSMKGSSPLSAHQKIGSNFRGGKTPRLDTARVYGPLGFFVKGLPGRLLEMHFSSLYPLGTSGVASPGA